MKGLEDDKFLVDGRTYCPVIFILFLFCLGLFFSFLSEKKKRDWFSSSHDV